MTRRAALSLALAGILLPLAGGLVALVALGPPAAPSPRRAAREPGAVDVVLAVIDTARADALTSYGAPAHATPRLAEIAKEGVVFENAFSPAPWTSPAMFSMITSLEPREHGIDTGATLGGGRVIQPRLPAAADTLAEELRAGGYETFGVCTNFHLSARFGFDQGFDTFVGDDFAFLPFPTRAVRAVSDRVRRSGKHFTWLHYFDPHYPYRTNEPWFGRANRSPYRSFAELAHAETARVHRRLEQIPPDAPLPVEDLSRLSSLGTLAARHPFFLFRYLKSTVKAPDAPQARFLRAAYSSEVSRVDAALAGALAELGVDDRTLVIITSDHGEELFDHGDLGHRNADSLYQELIRVPDRKSTRLNSSHYS